MIVATNNEYTLAKARLAALEQMREATGQGELSYDDSVRLRELTRPRKSLFPDRTGGTRPLPINFRSS